MFIVKKETREKSKDVSEYMMKDRFTAAEFEKNLDKNLKQARLAWQDS